VEQNIGLIWDVIHFFDVFVFFGKEDGWVAKYTNSNIASKFPYYEN